MDAIAQPGGHSPKPTNILMSTSQLKPDSDDMHNSSTSIPAQTKGKKRERGDHCAEPVKREHLLKTDSDFGLGKIENSLRSEIAKITEKGGLVDSEAVEKLLQLMQVDRIHKKMALSSRSILAGVIAATDMHDCLSQFIQLRGLLVLDEWLQDVHKGKIGDSSSSKDGDKSSEEFLFVLLFALDRLPVNLHALQTSNIGKSVNHLRSHKNLEIQKKARSLVDTWKKRVEAEMNVIDAKSGLTQAASWPSKSHLPESQGCRNCCGSDDFALKSSVMQLPVSNTASLKASQGDTRTKSSSLSPGPVKSASSPASGKELQPQNTVSNSSDVPLSTREDKSSSSSHSHNNSQSVTGKEDARSSAGSLSIHKILSGGSRYRKSSNGYAGTPIAGTSKETCPSRTSPMHKNAVQEKFSHSTLSGDKASDVPIHEGGSSHKLIVKIPNHGCSPARSMSGGSLEDPSIMSRRAYSPVPSDKHEQSDRNSKENCDSSWVTGNPEVNGESWQNKDCKYLVAGSEEGDGPPAIKTDEDHNRTNEGTGKMPEISKVVPCSSGNDLKRVKLHEASFSSMNAFIESCVKYSEASASMSIVDNVGMNLLASVAAGEICKSELVSPSESSQCSTHSVDQICKGDDSKLKTLSIDNSAQEQHQINDVTSGDDEKLPISTVRSFYKDSMLSSSVSTGDRNPASVSEEKVEAYSDHGSGVNEKSYAVIPSKSLAPTEKVAKETCGDCSEGPHKEKGDCNAARTDVISYAKLERSGSHITEVNQSNLLSSTEDVMPKVELLSSMMPTDGDCGKDVSRRLKTLVHMEQKPGLRADGKPPGATISGEDIMENVDEVKVQEGNENGCINSFDQPKGKTLEKKTSPASGSNGQSLGGSSVAAYHQSIVCAEGNVQNTVLEPQSSCSLAENALLLFPSEVADGEFDTKGLKLTSAKACKTEQCSSISADTSASAAEAANLNSKMDFDLNEGLIWVEGELAHLGCGSSSNVHVINPFLTVSSSSSSIPASITVAAAAKGPFVPPVDLLRNKVELGWKGSAATSAFRPAEPRKFLHLPVGRLSVSPDDSSNKASRPVLDIDLNIPGERLLEDMACQDSTAELGSASEHSSNLNKIRDEVKGSAPLRSSGGLDLDLNRVDDSNDMILCTASSSHRLAVLAVPVKSLSSSSPSTSEITRNFDLNNGPGVDDTDAEQSSFNQPGRSSTLSLQSQLHATGVRPISHEAGSFSACVPSGISYSSGNIPSVLPRDQPFTIIPPGVPQRIVGPPGGNPFTPDLYRGSVLSSSPAMPFPSRTFPYQMFPFGNIPLPSATMAVGSTTYMDSTSGGRIFNPTMNANFFGSVGAVSSQYSRTFMLNMPDGVSNGVVENNKNWSRESLDLNAGPGSLDMEGRDEALAQRQHLVANSHPLIEDQARIYPTTGGFLKRKEPEGGWNGKSFRYK